MSVSQSNAAARKPIHESAPSQLTKLMLAMGSTKGFDPMPPDQYLTYRDKRYAPVQRLWAWVLSKTVRLGHRSAYCVDEQGNELWLKHANAELGMDGGNVRRAWLELEREGRVYRDARRLCVKGTVILPDVQANKMRSEVYTHTLPPYVLRQIKKLPQDRQEELWTKYRAVDTAVAKFTADLVASGRTIGDRSKDTVLSEFGVKKIREGKRRETPPPFVDILAPLAQRYIHTRASPDVPVGTTPENGRVQTSASLVCSETEEVPACGCPGAFGVDDIETPQQQPSEPTAEAAAAAQENIPDKAKTPKPTAAAFAFPETLAACRQEHGNVTEHFVLLRVVAPALKRHPTATDHQIAICVLRTWKRRPTHESEGILTVTVPEFLDEVMREGALDTAPAKEAEQSVEEGMRGTAELLRAKGEQYSEIASELDQLAKQIDEGLRHAMSAETTQDLDALEKKMLSVARAGLDEHQFQELCNKLYVELKPFQKMSKKQRADMERLHLKRLLLEREGLPQLSLFHMCEERASAAAGA